MNEYLAIDIGASSGRHIIGYQDEKGELVTKEMYRFANGVKEKDQHFTWDIDNLFQEALNGIRICLMSYPKIRSMSIDTWGVDYVLLDKEMKRIDPVYAYRDGRTKQVIPLVHEKIPFEKLYQITGSQFQEFNTIYQLYDDLLKGRLAKAKTFMHIPEYLMYRLTGVEKHEYTNASTTGMMDGKTLDYSQEIIAKLGFPAALFHPLDKPGTMVGNFTPEVQKEVSGNIPVILCATHDTASAVEGIPMEENIPYISSGTWSLLGVKSERVILEEEARKANFSNEYGPDYIRFQKNIMGLWIIQCLSKEMKYSFPEMVESAKESSYSELFDVNDSCFFASLDMRAEILAWFRKREKPLPVTDGDIINATYRSLAHSYDLALQELERITMKTYPGLVIVGGGAKNQYLNDLTEAFTHHKVYAYPKEVTAIGNLMSQIKKENHHER